MVRLLELYDWQYRNLLFRYLGLVWVKVVDSLLIKLGREEPAMSMDSNGKIIFAKHSEIQQANLKNVAGKF